MLEQVESSSISISPRNREWPLAEPMSCQIFITGDTCHISLPENSSSEDPKRSLASHLNRLKIRALVMNDIGPNKRTRAFPLRADTTNVEHRTWMPSEIYLLMKCLGSSRDLTASPRSLKWADFETLCLIFPSCSSYLYEDSWLSFVSTCQCYDPVRLLLCWWTFWSPRDNLSFRSPSPFFSRLCDAKRATSNLLLERIWRHTSTMMVQELKRNFPASFSLWLHILMSSYQNKKKTKEA